MTRVNSTAILVPLFLILFSACSSGGGDGGGGPTAPSEANIGGLWNGTTTLQSAGGCGCVGSFYNSLSGLQDNFTTQVNQNGPSFTARATSNSTGLWCDYSGTVSSNSWSMNATQCNVTFIAGFTCANGNRRDLTLVSLSANGTVSGNTMTGNAVETWNCFNSNTGAGAGVLTIRSTDQQTR